MPPRVGTHRLPLSRLGTSSRPSSCMLPRVFQLASRRSWRTFRLHAFVVVFGPLVVVIVNHLGGSFSGVTKELAMLTMVAMMYARLM